MYILDRKTKVENPEDLGDTEFVILKQSKIVPSSGWESDPGYSTPPPEAYWEIYPFESREAWESAVLALGKKNLERAETGKYGKPDIFLALRISGSASVQTVVQLVNR
jgi:hypothetical protein